MNVVYVNPRAPGSFGGVEALRRYARKSRKAVDDYLAVQEILLTYLYFTSLLTYGREPYNHAKVQQQQQM